MDTTQRTEINDQILNKLAYIKTLKEQAATPGEAEAAAAAMTRMLTKYGLSMLELDARLGTMPTVSSFLYEHIDLASTAMWKRTLIYHIATFNFSRVIYIPGKQTVDFVGTEQNLALVQAMYAWLVLEVNALADKGWNEYRYRHMYSVKAWKNAYRTGVVAGLGKAMHEARAAEVAAYSGGSALVVVNDAALNEAVLQHVGKTTTKSLRVSNGDAYQRGYQTGRSVNISTNRIAG